MRLSRKKAPGRQRSYSAWWITERRAGCGIPQTYMYHRAKYHVGRLRPTEADIDVLYCRRLRIYFCIASGSLSQFVPRRSLITDDCVKGFHHIGYHGQSFFQCKAVEQGSEESKRKGRTRTLPEHISRSSIATQSGYTSISLPSLTPLIVYLHDSSEAEELTELKFRELVFNQPE